MKKLGGLLILAALIMPVFGGTTEASCANTSSLGAVELSVPDLPDRTAHVLWIRMQSSNPNGRVAVEVNNDACLDIGGGLESDKWLWRSADSGSLTFARTTGNKVKLIGVSDGIKIDRILLTEPGCTPESFGTNCQGAVALEQSTSPEIKTLPPPFDHPVSGKVMPSQTPVYNRNQLDRVEYIVEAEVIQTVYTDEPFDTTLVPSGKTTVQINTWLKDESVIREATVLDIKNNEQFYSATQRWVRLNMQLVKLGLIIFAGIVLLVILLSFLRKIYRTNRERKFHGF